MSGRRLPPPLLALVGPWDGRATPPAHELLARCRAAVDAGLRGLLLRVPDWDDGGVLNLSRQLRVLLDEGAPGDGWLALHDRPHLLAAAGADAVHLGFRSLPPRTVRPLVGEQVAIGFSSHAGDFPRAWAGADYLFHGPPFSTPSKLGLLEPTGSAACRAFAGSCSLPVWALGGITPTNAGELLPDLAGCAVLGGLIGSPTPARSTGEYLAALAAAGLPATGS